MQQMAQAQGQGRQHRGWHPGVKRVPKQGQAQRMLLEERGRQDLGCSWVWQQATMPQAMRGSPRGFTWTGQKGSLTTPTPS